jgi:hypothetical protein
MHPLNNKFFGNAANTSIQVHYNNGNGVAAVGYIVKQPSATFWRLANATTNPNAITDSNSFKSELVGNATPAVGQFTIYANPVVAGVANTNAVIYVASIDAHHVVCSDGKKYIWTLAQPLPNTTTGTPYAALGHN